MNRNKSFIFAIVLMFVLTQGLASSQASPPKTESLQQSGDARVGSPAPWFAGWTPENRVTNLKKITADLKAKKKKAAVLVFFGTWCKPCEDGLRKLKREASKLAVVDAELVFVAYLMGDPAEKVAPWLAARGFAGDTLIIDKFGEVARAFGGEVKTRNGSSAELPKTVVLDRGGVVRGIFSREGEDYVDRLVEAVRR